MASASDVTLHAADIAVIVIYFAAILFIGIYASRNNRGSVKGYFLAGRNMHWIPVGASLFASNVGSLHFVGLAGSGAATGISVALFEINAIYVVMLLGWLFLPVYITSGVYTMPEYIYKRFGGERIRIYLAVLSLLLYIFTKISADLYAGAIFIEQALRWNIYASIVLLLAIASIFTITGGLTAVIWTDFIQTIIMVIGSVTLMVISFIRVGGFERMQYLYERAIPEAALHSNNTCGWPREDYMHLMRKTGTDVDLPWPGVFGAIINSIWYWCADQVIVQRALAGKNFTYGKAGTVVCGYLKFLPLFILIFPGMISRILFTEEVACIDPDKCMEYCGSPSGCSNIAYPLLVLNLMPTAARGMMLAVMLSALMSSLTSIFNSSSTLFSIDIWRKIRKNASEKELLVVGRLCVLVLVGVSIAWVPVIRASQGSQLFVYIQQVSSFLTPPVCSIYILAILVPRLTEQGAFWGLLIGLLLGIVRFVLEFTFSAPPCGEPDNRPWLVKDVHHLYFSAFLFVFAGLVALIISIFTTPMTKEQLNRMTFWTRNSKEPRQEEDAAAAAVSDSAAECDAAAEQEVVDEKPSILPQGDPQLNNSNHALVDGGWDEEEKQEVREPWWKRAGRWVCGIEKQHVDEDIPELSEEELKAIEAKMASIAEVPIWRRLTNTNAIILMVCATFLWGFFA